MFVRVRRLPGAVPVFALLFVGCVWLFAGIVQDVVANDPLMHADIALYAFLQNLRTPPVDAAMRALAVLHGHDTGLIVAAAFLVWLMIHRCWVTSAWWLATVGIAVVLVPAVRGPVSKRNQTGASDRWVSKYGTASPSCRRASAWAGLSGTFSCRTRRARVSPPPDMYWLSQHNRATMEATPIAIGIR